MVERTLIYNAKGFQLGHIEGDTAFDVNGTRRCSYAGATGNLCDLNNGNIVGHVSLDGTFVGASWVSDDLFGKPSGEARVDRHAKAQRIHHNLRKASVQRAVNAGTQATAPRQPDAPAALGPATHLDYPEMGSNTSDQVANDMDAPPSAAHLEPNLEAPGSTSPSAENELLDRAIGMIRSALRNSD